MEYKVKHGLPDRARVRTVVEKAYEAYKERLANHDPTLRWSGDSAAKIGFSVMGKTLETDVAIESLPAINQLLQQAFDERAGFDTGRTGLVRLATQIGEEIRTRTEARRAAGGDR